MDVSTRFPFLMFPREIQLHILLQLKAPDIFRFREVCTAFSELASDVAVEYKVQLDIAGMVDNPSHGSPLIERYEKLLRYQEGWKKAAPSVDPNVPVRLVRDFDAGSYWEWTGGVFPYFVNQAFRPETLHLYQPGSSVRGTETKRWTVEAGSLPDGYKMLGCGVDKAQDLLVLVLAPLHYNPANSGVCMLQLLCLTRAGVLHPLASHPLLCGLRLRTDKPWPDMRPPQIHGHIVAYAVQNGVWEVEVWNWKTGALLLRFRPNDVFFSSFALLNCAYILTFEQVPLPEGEGPLKIYRIPPHRLVDPGSGFHPEDSGSQVTAPDAILELMPLEDDIECLTWLSYSPETTSTDGVPPFKYDDELSAFALSFDVEGVEPRPPGSPRSEQFLLLVSIRELLQTLDRLSPAGSVDASQPSVQAARRCLKLEWDIWGPTSTRLVAFKGAVWDGLSTISRTRFATVIRGSPKGDPHGFDHLLLFTAHPHAALGHGAHFADGPGGDEDSEEAAMVAELVACGDVFTHPEIFAAPVHTTLPLSVQCKRVARPQGPELVKSIDVGLFEDGLSLMYTYKAADGARRGDTFTFSV